MGWDIQAAKVNISASWTKVMPHYQKFGLWLVVYNYRPMIIIYEFPHKYLKFRTLEKPKLPVTFSEWKISKYTKMRSNTFPTASRKHECTQPSGQHNFT